MVKYSFQLVILHPAWSTPRRNLKKEHVDFLHSHNILVAGYISYGEDVEYKGPRSYYMDLNQDGYYDKNPVYGGYYVNGNEEWYEEKIYPKLAYLKDIGVDGVFIDTLDTITLEGADKFRKNYLQLLQKTREDFLSFFLIANRGFPLFLEEEEGIFLIEGILLENFSADPSYISILKELKKKRDLLYLGLGYNVSSSFFLPLCKRYEISCYISDPSLGKLYPPPKE